MDDLVSTEWLAANLGQPDLVVVDSSFFMPVERPRRPRRISRRAYPRRALPRHRRAVGQGQPGAAHAAVRRGVRRGDGGARHRPRRPHHRLRQFAAAHRRARLVHAAPLRRRARSRSSTAACRNGGRGAAGRERRAGRRAAPVSRLSNARGEVVDQGRRSAPGSAPPLIDARGRARFEGSEPDPRARGRRRPHPGRPQPAVRLALQG